MGLALDLEDYHPSVLLHCWLGHLTCKIVSEMTYNVSSRTLNPTIPYHSTAPTNTFHVFLTCHHTLFSLYIPPSDFSPSIIVQSQYLLHFPDVQIISIHPWWLNWLIPVQPFSELCAFLPCSSKNRRRWCWQHRQSASTSSSPENCPVDENKLSVHVWYGSVTNSLFVGWASSTSTSTERIHKRQRSLFTTLFICRPYSTELN